MRVDHARKLLENGSAGELSIEGIGKMSGFASRSSFYDAFKSETGLTPTEFLEQLNS
ncbi:MAG: helix-turn-helix domain-containing protein [Sphingobacteriaceae bacterium]